MTDEPGSITTMKRYYSDRLHVDTKDVVAQELLGGNDRSTIITVASFCEAGTESLIGQSLPHLREAEKAGWDLVFRPQGPLGTFSACIDMAFYLTLIDQSLRGQLHTLRDMRNAVAHTKRRVTFEDVQLQNVAKRLIAPTGMFPLLVDNADGIRRTFIAEGLLIGSILAFGRDEAIRKSRQSFVDTGRDPPF